MSSAKRSLLIEQFEDGSYGVNETKGDTKFSAMGLKNAGEVIQEVIKWAFKVK